MTQETGCDKSLSATATKNDNLMTIKGIGAARQQWLRESFDVRTFRDLATLSVDEVEARLKENGHIASRSEIEHWIAEAQELAETVTSSSPQMVERAEEDAQSKSVPSAQPVPWRSFAAFVVEFQERAGAGEQEGQRIEVTHIPVNHHGTWLENDRTKAIVEGECLHQWMVEQLGEGTRSWLRGRGHDLAVKGSADAPDVSIDISQVRAFQPPQAERPSAVGEADRSFLGFIRSDEPFALTASIRLTGPGVSEVVNEELACGAHFYARDLSTGTTAHLGHATTSPFTDGGLSCAAVLPQVTMAPGMYRIRVRAVLEGSPLIRGYTEVRMLQVV